MTGRDLFFVVVGFVIGWAGGATYGAYNRDWSKDIKASFDRLMESLYARYRLPDGRTHHQIGWDRQKTQIPGVREYPPLHPGGAKRDEREDWAFHELFQKRGLKPEQAWREYIAKFPDVTQFPDGTPKAEEVLKIDRDLWKARMKNRRRGKTSPREVLPG